MREPCGGLDNAGKVSGELALFGKNQFPKGRAGKTFEGIETVLVKKRKAWTPRKIRRVSFNTEDEISKERGRGGFRACDWKKGGCPYLAGGGRNWGTG